MPTGNLGRDRKAGGEKPQSPVTNVVFYGGLGLTLLCSVVITWMKLGRASTEEFGYLPHLVFVLILGLAIVLSLAITKIFPWRSRSLRDWMRPQVLGSFS